LRRAGAKGAEVLIAGKVRGARAQSLKFGDGYFIRTGEPARLYVDTAIRHVDMRQGMIGIRVSIMLPHDPTGKSGPKQPLPDKVIVLEPKEEIAY
jgi:small subunit ribosomal protein S3e